MRLGSYPCSLVKGTRAQDVYEADLVHERHRHRFEFNNKYRALFEKKGMTPSGVCRERDLVEILEISEHPWFIGVQFHPEFKSRPLVPHPLFTSFVKAVTILSQEIPVGADSNRKRSAGSRGRKGRTNDVHEVRS